MACQSLPIADWFPQHSFSVARQQWFTEACILTGWLLRVAYLKSYWTHEIWEEHACMLQSCSDAIEEVFNSKLHIIGGVGLTIGIVMASVDVKKMQLVKSYLKSYWLLPRMLNNVEKCCSSHFLFQVFGMIFSMVLCCAIRKSREVVWRLQLHHMKSINVAWCHSRSHMTLHCQ